MIHSGLVAILGFLADPETQHRHGKCKPRMTLKITSNAWVVAEFKFSLTNYLVVTANPVLGKVKDSSLYHPWPTGELLFVDNAMKTLEHPLFTPLSILAFSNLPSVKI
jgi:hypothetical protein